MLSTQSISAKSSQLFTKMNVQAPNKNPGNKPTAALTGNHSKTDNVSVNSAKFNGNRTNKTAVSVAKKSPGFDKYF